MTIPKIHSLEWYQKRKLKIDFCMICDSKEPAHVAARFPIRRIIRMCPACFKQYEKQGMQFLWGKL